jgi:hypothetical protein
MPDNGIKVKLRYVLLCLRLLPPCSFFFLFFSPRFVLIFSFLSLLLFIIFIIYLLFFKRFNKPILADIVGDAARNLLQSITDSAGTARMADLRPSRSADSRTSLFSSIYSFFLLDFSLFLIFRALFHIHPILSF